MIDIRTFRSKRNGIRVDLFRKYKHADPKTKKVTFSFKQLGSFSLADGYPPDLSELLQPDETIQLQNWLAECDFAAQFETEADDLAKYTIRMPAKVYEALTRLYAEAKRAKVHFVPNKVMLDALLDKAKAVQQKVDKINRFKGGILESVGIDTSQASKNKKR
jgi:hypothetical protein